MTVYYGACVFLLGLVFGSFLNCTAMRIVRGENFVRGRSHCPLCGHELSALELIPVVSYLIQGGRCRHCKGKISPRYITAELTFALLSLGLYAKLVLLDGGIFSGDVLIFFRDWVLTGCLFLVSLTDLESCEISDGALLFGAINFFVFAAIQLFVKRISLREVGLSVLAGLLTGAVMLGISLIMDRLLKKESLGGGDIKLFSLLGLYLGFFGAYELVLLSCILGLVFAGIRKWMLKGASEAFPFGPAIACSGYILLLFSDFVTGWYLSYVLL
jgi:leader peptidase (prepilin peptidase)/N-methyltransferase